jgi:phosphoserine phosphatase RsbU/P
MNTEEMTTGDVVVDVSQDWGLARDVQQRFMHSPGRKADSVDYSARCRQVRTLGGDCYDFMPLTDNRLALVVGDASGKGLAAALMIASVQSSLRTAALFTGNDLATLFEIVNHQAYTSSLADRYATLFYGVFDAATRTLRYVNAGHSPPIVLRADGMVHWLEPSGAPLGMFPDSNGPDSNGPGTNYQESTLRLNPGDLIIAYTDGVVEATNPGREEWGVQGLLKAIADWESQCSKSAEDLVQSIFNSMDEFSGGCQNDDATIAVLRVV